MGENTRPAVLGELQADLPLAVPGDQPLVVFAWPLGQDGRKRYTAGSAIATSSGEVFGLGPGHLDLPVKTPRPEPTQR